MKTKENPLKDLPDSKALADFIIISAIFVLLVSIAMRYDWFEMLVHWARQHEDKEVDEFFTGILLLSGGFVLYSIRRWVELNRWKSILVRQNQELQQAIQEMKTLKALLPICAGCKKIRDEDDRWNEIEEYIRKRTNTEFSHSICPDCFQRLYPDISW